MILMVSGRTDIVAFYSKWFMNRYQAGYFDVRNPFYPKLVSRIYVEDVDLIVFCTKNPLPILPHIEKIQKPILFHITLTPYKEDIEPNVISKGKIIEAIKKLSKKLGPDCLYVRYDPIFINEKYTLTYHQKAFEHLCKLLEGYVKHIIVSFLDDYQNVRKNIPKIHPKELTKEDYREIGISFQKSANCHGMTVQTCFEKEDLTEYGFEKEVCVSKSLAYQYTNKTFKKWQARKCGCVEMFDIGTYNTCLHLCKYCYANYQEDEVEKNHQNHDPNSSLLIGALQKEDQIKRRKS